MSEAQRISLESVLAAAPRGMVYGFIVSQAIYDALKEQIPQKFEGGNCINGTPIIVDPALPPPACDVAYTREAWNKRLKEIA